MFNPIFYYFMYTLSRLSAHVTYLLPSPNVFIAHFIYALLQLRGKKRSYLHYKPMLLKSDLVSWNTVTIQVFVFYYKEETSCYCFFSFQFKRLRKCSVLYTFVAGKPFNGYKYITLEFVSCFKCSRSK